jgi:hypothetical protein
VATSRIRRTRRASAPTTTSAASTGATCACTAPRRTG